MKKITEYGGQNWAITPVALALNERPPLDIQHQKWQLILSGVAIVNVKCTKQNDWSGESLLIYPDINGPLQYAITHFSIPVPATSPYVVHSFDFPSGIRPLFQIEEIAPFAALGSVFDQGSSVNAGFSVNTWRPFPFLTLTDSRPGGNAPAIGNVFTGLVVDVAVRDIDAWLFRVNYQITLVGKIVFARIAPEIIP